MVVITISITILLYRVVKGPTNPDRAIALDAIGINLMAMAGLVAIWITTTRLNDVILLIGILLFIGTIALAKYLEKGVIIDRKRD
ncbi:Na(+)/H(+) antiporter subunit F1 [Gracilibacillus xinjiangensis]|uniref:Na(+)/H(+) antiporter subunit F1 n=1 Tax=Gracilibacillus xinjiangensis TaxID=1193282 RepID=A0ABV8WXN2_9BACI